jgi:DNA-directed RNA polymerase subunit RPC12/RpoP
MMSWFCLTCGKDIEGEVPLDSICETCKSLKRRE